MATITPGDIFRMYVKPSLGGRIVFRKKNTIQTSARLEARKSEVAQLKPGEKAYERCRSEGKTIKKLVYVPGQGQQEKDVCPIQHFRKYLSEVMR